MPPKKREEKCDFSECIKCQVLVLPKDREKHESLCDEWTPGFDVDYDFISKKSIYGTVRDIQNRGKYRTQHLTAESVLSIQSVGGSLHDR